MKKHVFGISAAAAVLLCMLTACSSDRNVDDFTSELKDLRQSSAAESSDAPASPESSAAPESAEESAVMPESSADESSADESSAAPDHSSAGSVVLYDWHDTDRWTWWNEDGTDASFAMIGESEDTLMIDTSKSGPNPWSVQAKFVGVRLQQGRTYRLTFDYSAKLWGEGSGYDPSAHHALVSLIQDYDPYAPYFEATLRLDQKDFQTVTYEFQMSEPTDNNVFIGFSFGNLGETGCTAQIRRIQLEQLTD